MKSALVLRCKLSHKKGQYAYTVVFKIGHGTSATLAEHRRNTCMVWNKWDVRYLDQ